MGRLLEMPPNPATFTFRHALIFKLPKQPRSQQLPVPLRNLHSGSHGSHDYSQEQQTERRSTHLQIRKIRGEKFKL
jgi:hypothetical protein